MLRRLSGRWAMPYNYVGLHEVRVGCITKLMLKCLGMVIEIILYYLVIGVIVL